MYAIILHKVDILRKTKHGARCENTQLCRVLTSSISRPSLPLPLTQKGKVQMYAIFITILYVPPHSRTQSFIQFFMVSCVIRCTETRNDIQYANRS